MRKFAVTQLFLFFYCFTHTIYNATLTFPTLHTLIKILTLCYITVPNTALGKKVFTDLVLFKYGIFPLKKKHNHFYYLYCYTYIT